MHVRRAAAVLAAAVAVVGMAAGVPLAVGGPHPAATPHGAAPASATTPPASPTPTLAPGVIPWADLPAPPPPWSPSPQPTGPACTAADLRPTGVAGLLQGGGLTGGAFSYTEVLRARRGCVMPRRWSSATVLMPDGTRYDPSEWPASEPGGYVPAGGRAEIRGVWQPYCGPAVHGTVRVRVSLPAGGALTVPIATEEPPCRPDMPARSRLSISAPAVDSTAPSPPTYPWQSLRVSVDAPPAAAPGGVLRFTVTLTNAGKQPIALDPCPAYQVSAGGSNAVPWQLHQLDCTAVAGDMVASGASVTFAMQADIAADTPVGEGGLAWFLGWPEPGMAGRGVKAHLVISDHPERVPTPPAPYIRNASSVPADVAAAAPDGRPVRLAPNNAFGDKLAHVCARAAGARQDVVAAIGNANTAPFPGWIGTLGSSVLLPGTDTACDFLPSEETPSKPCAAGPRTAPATCGGIRFFTVTGPGGS